MLDERFYIKNCKAKFDLAGFSKKKKREKGIIDEIAAVILLQDYLSTI